LIAECQWDAVSFEALALQLHVSKPVLSRRFRRVARMTFRRWLMESRLASARQLLANSEHSITDIAQLTGFGDLPRFDKVFKAYVGMSPSAYRRRHAASDRNNKLLALSSEPIA
jgi:AraC-like DNA-binding protein